MLLRDGNYIRPRVTSDHQHRVLDFKGPFLVTLAWPGRPRLAQRCLNQLCRDEACNSRQVKTSLSDEWVTRG